MFLQDFFSDDASISKYLDCGGKANPFLPINIGNLFETTLLIEDGNLFSDPPPSFDFEVDLCPILDATKDIFQGLADEIISAISALFDDKSSTLRLLTTCPLQIVIDVYGSLKKSARQSRILQQRFKILLILSMMLLN